MDNVKYRFLGIPVWEKRSTLGTFKAPSTRLVDILGGESGTGINVTQNAALTFSAVWACTRIISNTVAMLPFGVYRTDSEGAKHRTPSHATHRLIHSEPNQIQSSFTWRQVMQAQSTLKGNAYSIIKRNAMFRPVELKLISNPDHVTPYEFDGDLYYKIQGYEKPFFASDIFHIRGLGFDGLAGKSVLSVARESIGSALAMQKYGNTVFKNGGAKRVALTHEKVLNKNTRDTVAESWNNTYAGADKLNKVAVIDANFKIQEVGMNPDDAQFIGSREFSVNEIARYFGLIMDLLATDNNPTYASAEQRALDFIKYTMTPWLVTWESEVNRKLFPDREKDTFYSKFTLEGLLRGDAAARAQYYKDMFYIGALSRDEIRALEDRNKIAGGEKYYLQSNMAEADKLQDIHNNKSQPKNENS